MDNIFLLRESRLCSKAAFFSRLVYQRLSFSLTYVPMDLCPPASAQNSDFCLVIELWCLYFPCVEHYSRPALPYFSAQITASMCLFLIQLYFNPESRSFFCHVHFCFGNCDYVSINMMSFLISSSLPKIFMKDRLGFSCRQLFHCYNQVYSRESDKNTHRVGDKLKM